jgi:hypothetical protein
MKQTIFVCSLLLMVFVYGSWRNNGSASATLAAREQRLTILENVFGGGSPSDSATSPNSPTGNGQPVTRDQYQPCLDSFVAVMGRYGITSNNPPIPIKTMPAMTYPITTSEALQGSGFITWLQGVVATFDPDGKGVNLNFQLKFGVCTPKFVADLGQPAALTGRITTFVVPAYRTTAAAKAVKAARAKALSGGDPGANGYELGGLEP